MLLRYLYLYKITLMKDTFNEAYKYKIKAVIILDSAKMKLIW